MNIKKKIVRAILIYFLGWIGSVIINKTSLKPAGWTSRSWLICLIPFYNILAIIGAFTFNPDKEKNLGYIKDGKSKGKGLGAWLKEKVRKFFVGLKKNPQIIPILALCASFLTFSLNLTDISNTTNKVQKPFMGLSAFVIMLFMILSFVCMLSAFPKRKKPNVAMIIVMMLLYGAIIVADIVYLNAVTQTFVPEYWTTLAAIDQTYILSTYNTLTIHIGLIALTIVCVLTEPLMAKLLKKIKTSINVEGSGDIANIDIADED